MITHCTNKSYMCLRKYLDSIPDDKLPKKVEGCKLKSTNELHKIFGDFDSIAGYGGMAIDMIKLMESGSRDIHFEVHGVQRSRAGHGCSVRYTRYTWASEIFEVPIEGKINSLEVLK